MTVGGGHPQNLGDDAHGKRGGQVRHNVEFSLGLRRVQQAVDHLLDAGSHLLHQGEVKILRHHRAQPGVIGRIGVQQALLAKMIGKGLVKRAPFRAESRCLAPGGSRSRSVDHVGHSLFTRQAGSIDRWFFIRYTDPGRHLRVRFHGPSTRPLRDALPALHRRSASPLAEGLLYRISIDTIERRSSVRRTGEASN